ncbi:MAG: sulfur carrier protein ThiS adenylyltransferase ThiF [Pseudomonadota bacterium]|nr:sulfur carrier protein ThiS adenylyltransferase ThiF [Pseudomonadota bacterium]
MQIFVNEDNCLVEAEIRLYELRDRQKPNADLMIVNGYPVREDQQLKDGDRVVLMRCGQQPTTDDLEALKRARHTPSVHEKIKNSCIGIAGVGGLGSSIAIALVRVGIGKLVIADFDLVEPSNLNRQHYFIDQIGLPKVLALRETLQRINPGLEIKTVQEKITSGNLRAHFSSVDVMVEAFDAADQKTMLISHFLSNCSKVPLVAASGMAGYASSNSITTRKVANNLYLCGDGVTAALPGQGLMAPRVGIAAHHQANAVLRLLLGEEPE